MLSTHNNLIPVKLYNQEYTKIPNDLYIDPQYLQILLEVFEGPLDLLLYLIRKQNLDILEIPIAKITDQYISYINAMENLNINLAAEYLVMAATLLTIKSRMLLPTPEPELENNESDIQDPKQELINRLLEYERIKLAANNIDNLAQIERDYLWSNIFIENSDLDEPQICILDLQKAWQRILKKSLLLQQEPYKITKQLLSTHDHMDIILEKLMIVQEITFNDLFDQDHEVAYVIVHFIAILELSRDGLIKLYTKENDVDIIITLP